MSHWSHKRPTFFTQAKGCAICNALTEIMLSLEVVRHLASHILGRDATPCYGGVSRHQTKVTQLRQASESAGKVFLHLNAGSMLGGYIWYPILGHEPMTEAIQDLKYNALVINITIVYQMFEKYLVKY